MLHLYSSHFRAFLPRSVVVILSSILLACASGQASNNNTSDSSAAKVVETSDWVTLFDGSSMQAWTNLEGGPVGKKWQVVNKELVLTGEGGGDILTKESYENFELVLDWKISAKGNSGIFYRVADGAGIAWMSGLEYQILDDQNHPGLSRQSHSAGSVFDVIPPNAKVINPPLTYNTTRIVVKNNYVEHWLNGVKVVAFDIGSDVWTKQVSASKFANAEKFAKTQSGRIGLQDHGNKVWFKNIKIREL
ncbi:hypothetical protein TDB9533_04668 [Thalassocella blandensis]|nr:hypothetical protein TDB9533_04668 [Thalassocella blandensis]